MDATDAREKREATERVRYDGDAIQISPKKNNVMILDPNENCGNILEEQIVVTNEDVIQISPPP